jgi:glutamate:GABA antiporter
MSAHYIQSPDKRQKGPALISEDYVPKVMPKILNNFDMISMYLVVIFFIINATGAASGGSAAFTYLALGSMVASSEAEWEHSR